MINAKSKTQTTTFKWNDCAWNRHSQFQETASLSPKCTWLIKNVVAHQLWMQTAVHCIGTITLLPFAFHVAPKHSSKLSVNVFRLSTDP